jgi:hypothetical protein
MVQTCIALASSRDLMQQSQKRCINYEYFLYVSKLSVRTIYDYTSIWRNDKLKPCLTGGTGFAGSQSN